MRNVNRSVIDHRSLSGLLPLPEVDQIEVGRRAVRCLRCGVDAEHDLLDLELGVGGAGRHGGDLGAVTRERGVRQLGREEPEAPGPVLLDRGAAARIEIGDEPVQEILGRGIERIRLRRCGLVGHGLGAADLVDPHHDRPGRLDGRDPEQEHAEREARGGEDGRQRPELPVGLDGLAPDFRILAAGIVFSVHGCLLQPPGIGGRAGFAAALRRPPPRTTSAIMPDPTDPEPETSIAASSPTFMPAIRPETTSGSRTTTQSPSSAGSEEPVPIKAPV